MAHPEIYANRDGTESISTMWVEDKRLLCRRLDAKHRWKDLASHQDLRLTQDDVLLLSQASPRESPSEGLFNRMAEKRTNMLELYEYLHQADLLAVMNIVQKYIPPHYHVSSETDMLHDPLGEGNSLAPPVPAPPPPLSPLPAANQSPMSLLAPQDFHQAGLHNSLPGLSLDDSGHSIQQELDSMQIRAAHTIMATRNFDIADILKATNDFDEQYMIAKGAYSSVYKVNLMNTDFAAKVYDLDYNSVKSDLQETRLHNHENIVSITGKCLNGPSFIILYEFMTNQSLRHQLDTQGVLNMDRRVTILRDAARGIQYLHSNVPSLLHRNIKSTNILLDDGLKAKLSDFGMAVHVNKKSDSSSLENSSQCYTHFSTLNDTSALQRSKGYCSKEVLNGRFSVKTDTYAFGVVIYETLTRLKAYDSSRSRDNRALVDYIEGVANESEDVWNLRDKTIRWEQKTYFKLFRLAKLATADRPKCRPTMKQVYSDLDEIYKNIQSDKYDSEFDEEMQPMSSLPPMQSEYVSGFSPLPDHMSLPVVGQGHHYGNQSANQHRLAPFISQQSSATSPDYLNLQYTQSDALYPPPALHYPPVGSQSMPVGNVERELSIGDSSLGLSSLGDQAQSLPEEGGDTPSPHCDVTNSDERAGEQTTSSDPCTEAPPSESLENESSLPDAEAAVSADSMDSCDLQVYLDKAAQRIQLMNGEDSEDDSELDPDLVAELAGLDLETPS